MHVLVALDSFKGSLSATAACDLAAAAWRSACPQADVSCLPMADGGEGTAAALVAACRGRWCECPGVAGPLPGQRLHARYGWIDAARTAIVEMAEASGLTLVPEDRRRPDLTTTRGTGELLAAALQQGAARLLLTLGGSATHDGGTGAAAALGWRFLDALGRDLPPGGAALCRLARIVPPPNGRLAVPVEALCDVDNPLTGPRGAAAVYAPQKGASPEMVRVLEEALQRLAERWRADLGLDLEAMPGAGAAGGFGGGAVAFLGARLTPGVEAVAAVNGLPARLRQADWVLTGEGRFDEQSLQGKVVSGVLRHAASAGTRVAVVAGSVTLPEARWRAAGVAAVEACAPPGLALAEAMRRAPGLLQAAVTRLAQRTARQAG